MSDKKVVIVSDVIFFEEIMDESVIPSYVTDAKTQGYFVSSDSTAYIPWESASVLVKDSTAV